MKLNKKLGQHFLNDNKIAITIVGYLNEYTFDNLVEIGPGAGALTQHIIKQFFQKNIKYIEIDKDKVEFLKNKFPTIVDNIIHQDILLSPCPFAQSFIFIGNFPYYISSQIIFKIIQWLPHVEGGVGMFQKEVAQRLVSNPNCKEYGIISVLTGYYFDMKIVLNIQPIFFTPAPKVTSSVVQFFRKKDLLPIASKEKFFMIVKNAFNYRRKILRNNLKYLFPENVIQSNLFDKRAENLSIADFAALTFLLL